MGLAANVILFISTIAGVVRCQCPEGEIFSGFSLVDGNSNTILGKLPIFLQYGPGEDDDLISTQRLNIIANICDNVVVGSVSMDLDGEKRCERLPPFSAMGDNAQGFFFSKYIEIGVPPATHIVSATAYSGNRCNGGIVRETFSQPFVILPPEKVPSVDRICVVDRHNTTAGCLQDVVSNSIVSGNRPCGATFEVSGPTTSSLVRAIRSKLIKMDEAVPRIESIHRDWFAPFYSFDEASSRLQDLSGVYNLETKIRLDGVPRFAGVSTVSEITIEPLRTDCMFSD